MDSGKGQRFGKPYGYRNAYMSHNGRLAFDDRLRFPGISTGSNSSWTFSNSHDLPKPRKGRICGIFLIGAVLVVALSVMAIAGLAFYIGGYSTERHEEKEEVDAKGQYSAIEITESPSLKHAEKVSAPTEKSTAGNQVQTKRIPAGTILGISKKMQELITKRSKEKKNEETTETSRDFVTNAYESAERVGNVRENVEMIPENSENPVKSTESDEDSNEFVGHSNNRKTQNGHARPVHSVAETTIAAGVVPLTSLFPPERDYSDEPWRPIVPSYREVVGNVDPYGGNRRVGSVEPFVDDGTFPITFSKDSFDRNLRITPEYAGNGNGFVSRNEPDSNVLGKIVAASKNPVHPLRGSIVSGNEAKISNRQDASNRRGTNAIPIGETGSFEAETAKPKPDSAVVEAGSKATESEMVAETEFPVTSPSVETAAKAFPEAAETGDEGETTPAEKNDAASLADKAEVTTELLAPTTASTETSTKASTAAMQTTLAEASSPSLAKGKPLALPPATVVRSNSTVVNPFADDSRSSSTFNFGLPDLPILKQFHHLDSLFKSFSKTSENEMPKHSSATIETPATRFPARTRQTTAKSYREDDSGPGLDRRPTTTKATMMARGDVEVVSGPVKQDQAMGFTTEAPKLITLLPVRSNVNMMRPLRPRPKSNASVGIAVVEKRRPKMTSKMKENDSEVPTSVRHSSMKATESDVEPEPKNAEKYDKFFNFTENLTVVPLYNTIENLLNQDHRNREANLKNSTRQKTERETEESRKNTSEIVERIVKIMGNVAISTGDSPETIVKVNQTVSKKPTTNLNGATANDSPETGYPAAILSPRYKLNQAGVPILTRILNKVPHSGSNTRETGNGRTSNSGSTEGDTCLSSAKKCNRFVDCPDGSDEKNCTCADYLKAEKSDRKLCDGIVDCWDFTDEYNCQWCKNEFPCSNSRACVRKVEICDGKNDCPMGEDERNCVAVSTSEPEAETVTYHPAGYLMVRKNGRWGRLCVDNFERVSQGSRTGWKITDLGRTVCKALTFRDFERVEKLVHGLTEGKEKFYELAYDDSRNGGGLFSRKSILTFKETDCEKKEIVKVTCTDLECGVRAQGTRQWSRIVGGGNAAPGAWPWQAALYKEGEYKCGGTLISANWLISAGHCFHENRNSYWVARLGNLRNGLHLPSAHEQIRRISKIRVHPQYAENGFVNDISLLEMDDPVRFTDFVRPICLPEPRSSIMDGSVCTIVGWGRLSEVGWVFPDVLQEVEVPIFSTDECRKRTLFMPLYKMTDDMFCASNEGGGRDACLGDSGGPLMCREDDGKWTLYGITSNGYGCGRSNRPGIYTKVSNYLSWINSHANVGSDFVEGKRKSDPFSRENSSEDKRSPGRNKPDSSSSSSSSSHAGFSSGKNIETKYDSSNYSDDCKGIRCPLGECLPKSKLCDGRIECSDGSDEKNCW